MKSSLYVYNGWCFVFSIKQKHYLYTRCIKVNVWNPMNEMDMSQALKNSEFEVVDSKIRRFITYYRCCVEPFPDIKVSVANITLQLT